MRIIPLLLIGILISLTAAAASDKSDNSKGGVEKKVASVAAAGTTAASVTSSTSGRTAKALKSGKPGDNRGKRTLYDFGNAGYLYPQIAARRGGYSPDPRTAYSTQPEFFNGQNGIAHYPAEYNFNYGPYPQYIEAPEPIIEIIIKDANETLSGANPLQTSTKTKTKKKKEKVHVFYVNYKKDENNKLHLESPIASLNNDETEEDEEEEEEEEVVEYGVTPLPPIKSTTLRTIIHPDSEKYHSNSGIHVTFGSEDKSQRGHILEEHDAESIQRQVVAVPIPQTVLKTQYPGNARQDFHGQARSPFTSNFFQTTSNAQYQPTAQQQLPTQHATSLFRAPLQQQQQHQHQHQQQQQHQPHQQHQSAQYSQNYHQQKPPTQQKSPFNVQPPQSSANQHQHPQPHHHQQQQQQPLRKPLSQIQQHIHQQLQQQSQYYVNHNQFYQQQPQQSSQNNGQYYHSLAQKPTQPPKQQTIVFPTAPSKSQELPIRQPPQPYQPIKFRPTPAPVATQTKPTPIAAKLENTHYSSKPYQFQRQPQFIQQPTFTVQSPTAPPQSYKQQSPAQHPQQQQQVVNPQTSNYQTSSIYYTQNKNQQQQPAPVQRQTKYQEQTSAAGTGPGLSWLDIKPSKETELLKSIPKFEQHITETIQHSYQPGQYQAQNQVIHDIPAPNLAPQQHQQQQLQSQYINSNSFNGPSQSQSQQQFSNFVTTSSNAVHHQQVATSTPAPQFVQSTDGQKIMVVTPMPPNVYQQYQSVHYPTTQGNQQQSAQIVTSIHQSQDQYNNYFQQQQQQPRQGLAQVQAQSDTKPSSQPANTQFSVSTYHSDVFKELEQRKSPETSHTQNAYIPSTDSPKLPSTTANDGTTTTTPNPKALLQLPDEVPDDLRQQLLSSGILSNADISVLDYDKVGDIALENLPAEHLQHFYGAGGGAQISESKKVLSVLKPNGDKVSLDEKELERVKESSSVPYAKQTDAKVVRFDGQKEPSGNSNSAERQYNRYLPLKINAANFPKPNVDELRAKSLQSIVVLAPVDTPIGTDGSLVEDTKEVKFLGGDLIKVLVKKPTKDNFKRWLEKESRTDVEQQSVVLLVTKSTNLSEQEIYMYDIATGEVNKLNGELSSKFVSVAEENASTEDLEHGSTLDPTFLESMIQKTSR